MPAVARGGGGGGGDRQVNNANRDVRANNVRSTSVNNVSNRNTNINANKNVNVNVNNNRGGCCGGGWDNDYHPVATAAAVTPRLPSPLPWSARWCVPFPPAVSP